METEGLRVLSDDGTTAREIVAIRETGEVCAIVVLTDDYNKERGRTYLGLGAQAYVARGNPRLPAIASAAVRDAQSKRGQAP